MILLKFVDVWYKKVIFLVIPPGGLIFSLLDDHKSTLNEIPSVNARNKTDQENIPRRNWAFDVNLISGAKWSSSIS